MTFAELTVALHLAASLWGPAPCGEVHIVEADTFESPTMVAAADRWMCSIVLNKQERGWLTSWPNMCTDMVHEWGHLTGQKHSPDPRNVMYWAPRAYWRCGTRPKDVRMPFRYSIGRMQVHVDLPNIGGSIV